MKKLRYIALCLAITCGSSSAQFADSIQKHHPQGIDDELFFSINHWGDSSPWLDTPMKFVTNTAFVPVVAVPIGLYVTGMLNDDREVAVAGFSIGAGLATSVVVGELVMKNIIKRVRPYHVIEGTRLITEGAHGYSFPSGHSSSSFGLAAGLSLHFPKWYIIAPTFAYATVVALSRPYLGAHYVTDLIGGAILGVLSQWLWYELERYYPDRWNIFPKRQPVQPMPPFTIGASIPIN